ncbi:MAG TPA: cyclic peptide export ABC transporter [Rheinheimera sp.]|uniref:cyclic peptide export ABC transporter n=1 Tax=Rheinheimera sp. TaxID=1869214 RepID=UPI000EBDB740|nr:cyclic peptide export ABC transporter [Rheinheimera sp.]HCU64818.1 cyclic peptide export ABC transporter [Rheinheimera sp.]
MSFVSLLSRYAPNRVFFSILMGCLAGLCYALMIPLIMLSIETADPQFPVLAEQNSRFFSFEVTNPKLAGLYISCCLLILLLRSSSEIVLYRLGVDFARNIREVIYRHICAAAVESAERLGPAKLIAAINIDVPRIVNGARIMPAVFINSVTVIGMLVFLLCINSNIFYLVIAAICAGVVIYQVPVSAGRRVFEQSRAVHDNVQESVRALIYGQKELKLDAGKRQKFMQDILLKYEYQLAASEKLGLTMTSAAVALGDLMSFFVIGAVVFIFANYHAIDAQTMAGAIMALLYISGPVGMILNSVPSLSVARVSHRKVLSLLDSLPPEASWQLTGPVREWQHLVFTEMTYHYPASGGDPGFKVGPLNFSINKAEILFIVGGNGSGKSTISKLITQHYLPASGGILLDGVPSDNRNIAALRSQTFAIFSDFYLFEQLLIELNPALEAKARTLLIKLRLADKVRIDAGRFSTTALSDGQRKRLALLVALLEDKALYLFDEWAADQDPEFRNIFYTYFLPELRQQNKAVVVISHDEKYFPIADRVMYVEAGTVKHITRQPLQRLV